ncbi:PAS domain S-box protein [Terasakiella pusilla]|uniref:PAS domain S-box protein n=1 Tax=Terasakiella pusilla TaxID=64973 RepID=UPI00068C314F|nr:PAS domain S-box protein [Terasakiella pusilla]
MKQTGRFLTYSFSTALLLGTSKVALGATEAAGDLSFGPGLLLTSFVAGLGLGALLLKKLRDFEKEHRPQSRQYLAAFEHISKEFNQFLHSAEEKSKQEAIDWLLKETAKTLDVNYTSLWIYQDQQSRLVEQFSYNAKKPRRKQTRILKRHKHPAFFGTLRGERTIGFSNAEHDVRSQELVKEYAQEKKPSSLLVAQVGIGRHTFGTLHIATTQKNIHWTDSDRQFAGSIADLIAFYLANKNLQGTQEALFESESRFRDLVDASSDWYWQTGPDHRFMSISERFTTLTGIPNGYMIGTTRHNFDAPESLTPQQAKHYDDLVNRRAFRDYKYSVTYKGKTLIVTINGKPLFDNSGTFLGYIGTGSDISENVASKTRFEEILNALPNGLVMWDSNDKLMMWNKATLDLFPSLSRYTDKHPTYTQLIQFAQKDKVIAFPEDFDDSALEDLTRNHRAGGIRELELADGTYLLVHEHPTSEGGIVGIYTDVTALRSRENELIESNKISEILTLSGNTLIHARNESFILSEICRIIASMSMFSSAWVSLFNIPGNLPEYLEVAICKGLDISPLVFKPSSTLKQVFVKQKHMVFSENILRQAFPEMTDQFTQNNIKAGAVFLIRIDTKIAGFLCITATAKDSLTPKRITLLEELANDIGYGVSSLRSEQSRLIAEEALRESESRYRSLVDMSPDAILVLDANDRIVFANPEGHTLFASQSRTEILGKRFANYVCGDNLLFDKSPRLQDEDPTHIYSSIQLRRLDDEIFEADITTRPVSYAGLETRLLIIRDVTEQNRVNDHLAQTSKLATLGEMAAGITHELSQPLNIMRFAAEGSLLKMARGDMPKDQIQKQFDLISMQSARMADIIDHMRVFSRKDTGSVEVFDPALVIRQAVDMIEAQYLAEDIHLDVRYPAYYQMLKGRPIQLEQVILNLITNAHDAINQRRAKNEDDPKTVNRIDLNMTYDQADNRVNIAVTDNGSGISEESMAKLFDPFFTTKDVGKGTGLGLSVSYGIIAAMGGNIQARNIHKGARFDINLPCIEDTTAAFYASLPPVPDDADLDEEDDLELDFQSNGLSVLVVDDEVYAAEAMMEYLFSNGFDVNMAGDGEEALELYDAEPCDIVVTDIRMPRMDGYTLIKHLHERRPDLPIIVVTGHTGMEEVGQDNLQESAFAILKKPVSLSNLVRQVEKAGKMIAK